LQPRLCFQESGLVSSFGPSRITLDQSVLFAQERGELE